ncbi:flagellar protein [Campylobacter jejuni]|uniref:Flagellar protein n=1 Tax=Campylobacter jejuni TaxID=197 RepID=A0A6F9MSX8_CAMJU|nr:flagellar protein [Campylobacter coli]NHH49725.1 flagellar protein [Campylobacter coli]
MKIIFLVLLSICTLFSFELTLNTGRENNQAFAVLHASNDLDFTCQKITVEDRIHFECEIVGIVDNQLKDQNFTAFDLKFIKEPQKIKMIILPKMSARMFDLSQNIYIDKELDSSTMHKSKSFTFIFTPELERAKDYDGLDFNINFPHESLPYVGALDLNSNPVIIPQSADINTYLRIKNEYDKANYTQVITDAQNAINRYRGSIFMNEFILYKLRAQSQIYTQDPSMRDQQVLEKMIDEAKNWNRTFTSDRNFPEVLYIMLRTYIALSQRADIEYTMSILNNEQPNSYFTQLARLNYADYIYSLDEKERAIDIYENIYFNTKNLDLAARAAMGLIKDYLLNNQINKAVQYVNTILKANPEYFPKDMFRSLEIAKLFNQHKQYDISANIYEDVFAKMPKIDSRYEQVLKDLALTLTMTSRSSDAKKYLDLYMDNYLDGKYLDEIRKANDEVFFALADNNATFLHQRYANLMKEYAQKDENIANKALSEDVALYYKEGNLSAVLAYKDQIEQNKLANSIKLLEQAATRLLNKDLKADNCINAVKVFTQFNSYEVGQKIENKKQMLACLIRTSNMQQAMDYIDKNYNEDSIYYGLQKASILYDDKQYPLVLNIAREISNSRILKSEEENFKAYYLQFLSYLKLNDYNMAIKILQILESFPMNFTMVEAYDNLLIYANDHNMQTTILNYAPKAIDYQNLKGINLFSPNLEFIYLDTLAKTNQNQESLAVLTDLLKLKLSDEDRARALYIQSMTYERMQNVQAQKESLRQCLELKTTSNWQNLCRDKSQILAQ